MFGGEIDKEKKYIGPTVVMDVGPGDSLMSELVYFSLLLKMVQRK